MERRQTSRKLRFWRFSCLAAGTLTMCSCAAPGNQGELQAPGFTQNPPLTSSSYAGDSGAMPPGPGMPMPPDMVSMYGMRPTQPPPLGAQQLGTPANGAIMPVGYLEPQGGGQVSPESVQGLPYDPMLGYSQVPYMPGYPAVPLPQDAFTNWSPPGLARPWPEIEYLRDGGDRYSPAAVDRDWNVQGVETEDTIAHFDTTDGLTHVEPSNRVHIYAPRFSAVRSVTNMEQSDQITRMDRFRSELGANGVEVEQGVVTHLQQDQLAQDVGTRHVEGFERRQFQDIFSRAQQLGQFSDRFLPYEDLQIIRQGIFKQSDAIALAAGRDAAITWAHDAAVQVVLNGESASINTDVQGAEVVYTVNSAPGPARLRVVKVASTNYAQPGEIIDFTIRYDNTGAQVIGNVTLIDNLTTRLEYVEGSAQSSLDAEFFADRNEGDSLRLRWEIRNPLKQGEGGVIRFRCRVR